MQLEIHFKSPKDEPQKTEVKESTCHKFIVDNFLVDYRKNTYVYQLKLAKKLFAFIPDFEFWKWARHEISKVYTLKDLLEPNKIRWLKTKDKKRKLDMKPTERYYLSSDYFYKVRPNKQKPKTKLDFLNYEPKKD